MRNRSNLCKKMDFEKFDDRTLLTQGRDIESNQLVFRGNHLNGFYLLASLAFNELIMLFSLPSFSKFNAPGSNALE